MMRSTIDDDITFIDSKDSPHSNNLISTNNNNFNLTNIKDQYIVLGKIESHDGQDTRGGQEMVLQKKKK